MSMKILDGLLERGSALIEERCGAGTSERVRAAAESKHAELESTAPVFKKKINRDNFTYGTAGLAFYRALQAERELDGAGAREIVGEAMRAHARAGLESSWFKRVSMANLARSKMMARGGAKAFAALKEPKGWLATLPDTDAHWAFDVHQCGLMLWLAEHDATELCPVFCSCDDVAVEFMKGLRFERNSTLAEGAEVCDFRYFRE